MPRLVVEKGVDKGREVLVTSAVSVVVGRDVPNAPGSVRLTDNMVSRTQFKIVPRDGGYFLIDGDSRNGTFLNGQRVKEAALEVGAKIDVGETMLSFLADTEETKRGGRIGQMIGGYRIVERVGRGGMGTVYKALQLSLNRVVALKLLAEDLIRDQNFINLFISEARAAAQLNHPNIVQVYDVNRAAERSDYLYFFSMEYLPNGSVQDHLGKEKKLTPKKATRIILDAARGLEYAEKKKIVHRDIKPDNLMIGEDGIVKICDLGLAKKLDPAINVKDDKEQGCVFGTPHYVAPEQALGKPADHRSDIYSLGSTFYRLLAGQTPYQGASAREIVISKVKTEPIPLVQMDPTVPEGVVSIVEKMMKKNPDERYQSAADVVQSLEAVKVELEGGPTTIQVPGMTTRTYLPPSPVQGILVPLFMILVMGGLGAAGYFGYRYFHKPRVVDSNPPPPILPPRDNSRLEGVVRDEWDRATNFERQRGTGDRAAVEAVLREFETVQKHAGETSYAKRVEDKIADISKKLKGFQAQDALTRVEKARDAIQTLLKSSEERGAVEKTYKQRIEELTNAAKDVEKDFDGTDQAKAARRIRDDEGKAYKTFAQEAQSVDKLVSEVNALKGECRFGAAEKKLADFGLNLAKDSWFGKQVADLHEALGKEAAAAWEKQVRAPVEEKVSKGDFDGARKLLAEQADVFDLLPLRNAAGEMKKAIDKLEEARANEAAQRQREADVARYEDAYVRGLPSVGAEGNYRFDQAHREVEAVREAIKTPDVAKAADGRLEVLARAGALKTALIQRANGKAGGLKKDKTIWYMLKQVNVELTGNADEDQVEVSCSNGTIVRWGQAWPPRVLCGWLQTAWDLSAEEHLGLALFALEESVFEKQPDTVTRLLELARVELGAAKSAPDAAKQPRVVELAGRLTDDLDAYRGRTHEEVAVMCLHAGMRAVKEEHWADAVRALEWLTKRCDDTQVCLTNQKDIKEALDLARSKLPPAPPPPK